MSSQASLSRPSRLGGASSSAAAGPLSPRAATAAAPRPSRLARRKSRWGALAVAAATTLALSSSASAASAFVPSPLHGAAPGRGASPPPPTVSDAPPADRRRGPPRGDGAAGGGAGRRAAGPPCPPLVMVLADPETTLRDAAEAEARMWRRGRALRPAATGGEAAPAGAVVDASYLEELSMLKLDLGAGAFVSDFPSAIGGTGISIVKDAEASRKARKAKGTPKITSKITLTNTPKSEARVPQTIESEIEVVTQEALEEETVHAEPKAVEPAKSETSPRKRTEAAAAAGTTETVNGNNNSPRTALRTVSPAAPRARASAVAVAETALAMAASGTDVSLGANDGNDGIANAPKAKKAVRSRSSTMPGFASRKSTGRRKSFRDGVALVERRSGKSIKKKLNGEGGARRRTKANSEAMYRGSASVPDSLIAFTNEIHEECSRITPTEEIELGTLTQEAIRIQTLHDDLEASLGREPTDEEWCAAAGKINASALRAAIDEGMEAKNRLVTSNLRMVQGVVNLYIRNGLGSQYNAGDLMQEGIMALIRAAEKFDPSRGFRFSTYAMYWIRAAVKRSQILQSRVVQVPQRLHETHKRVLRVEKELRTELGRNPTKEELAQASDLSVVQLERCLKAMAQECHSLDATIQNTLNPNKNDARRKDTMYDLVDSGRTGLEDDGRRELLRTFSREALVDTLRRYLTPHEVDLLLLRYGLMDERTLPHGFSGPLTIAEVSRLVGLKPDKVRRMINGCLRQLRPLIAHEWENFENELP